MISLYEDQKELICEIKRLWKDHNRIMVMAPTGAGKTRIAAYIIKGHVDRGLRVCFIVPRVSLISQTAKVFTDLGINSITYQWGDFETSASALVTISSADTMVRRPKLEYDIIVHDEAHHRRKQILNWMNEYPEDRYLALSATPYSPWLGNYYTALAKSKPMWWLIENNRLAPYDVYCPTKPDLSNCKTVNTSLGKDYKESDIAEVMGGYKLAGDIVSNWMENGENRPTILLAINKAHAGGLTNEFNKYGIPAELVTAETPIEERQRIFDRVREGITKILLSIDCLTEGFDMVEISCLINARPTRSKARFVQGIGRLLRYAPGKRGIIFDHAGSFLDPELGFVEYIDIDELQSGSDGLEDKERVKKEIEKLEKAPKECSKCTFLKPAGVVVCPKCGHRPIYGEEVETDVDRRMVELKKSLEPKKEKFSMEDKQKFYSELLGWQKERAIQGKPVKDGYLSHKYRQRFGVWPKNMNHIAKVPSPETRNWLKSQMIRYAKGMARRANN